MKQFSFSTPMTKVPPSLRVWFFFHFLVDIIFGMPLLLFPKWTFSLFGLPPELFAGRLIGAALLGIGGVSLLVRKEGREVYRALLKLKMLWSGSAILGLLLSISQGAPPITLAFLGIFVFFFSLWGYYFQQVTSSYKS